MGLNLTAGFHLSRHLLFIPSSRSILKSEMADFNMSLSKTKAKVVMYPSVGPFQAQAPVGNRNKNNAPFLLLINY